MPNPNPSQQSFQMKIEFDGLNLIEAKMLVDVLTSFRARIPFHWAPREEENASPNSNHRTSVNRIDSSASRKVHSNGPDDQDSD